ncbi:MAG: PEP/pyruvate-binding domain-containing protein [Bacteroidota bacterium]
MDEVIDNQKRLQRLLAENTERLKELACINQATQILKDTKPVEELLAQLCLILPKAWQYPEFTNARIHFDGRDYRTPRFCATEYKQNQHFETIDDRRGFIEICYTKEFPECDEGPFLKEERNLLNNLANIISGNLNSTIAKTILKKGKATGPVLHEPLEKQKSNITGQQLLQRYLNKQNYDRNVFHDLMTFKVREILLIANLYDAYNIEKEGRFAEHILGEYYQLNLTSMPRVTGVSSSEEAFEQLRSKHYDLIIFMMGSDKDTPIALSKQIKEEFSYIPIFILLNNNSDIETYESNKEVQASIDKIFVWNGEPKVFFAMVKYLEDKVNVENDTRMGLVRVVLLVEDSARYYSRYLPLLYANVLEQTKRIIEDVNSDELLKVLRLRARPKILLARNYEEAIDIFNKYKEYMLCLITDMKFDKDEILDENAGAHLVQYVRQQIKDLPTIVQSSDPRNASKAFELKSVFIDKNSPTLLQDIQSFITHYLGFGNFIYKNADGSQISIARSLREFEVQLRTVPDESLIYHARRDHFSLWLMARGEVQLAKYINPYKVQDFKTSNDLREFMLNAIQKHRSEQNRGKVIAFEETDTLEESSIVSLASGSLGGKGRGVAFINTLIYNFDFHQLVPNINVRCPKTLIIGTDEFDYFLDRNHLRNTVIEETDYNVTKQMFMAGRLSEGLIKKLKKILKLTEKPLAVRSSGLFEDSLMQPFAGIFETYLLPNCHPDIEVRLKQLADAIKLVYASVYSKVARGYVEAINYKIEDERMAIVLQEVVGNRYEDVHYPHISGVAQSYNYYPFAHMKPEEGFAVAALGLGTYVVEGERAYRFSPKYPTTDINSSKDQYKNSQVNFYAVDLKDKNLNLLDGEDAGLVKLEIEDAERHGNMRHCASVYDAESERIVPGLSQPGPRIVNFANILKYNYIPLAETLQVVLDIVKEAMGSPVEIEFAVDLNKDSRNRASFYLLQIKPLIGNADDYVVNMDDIPKNSILLYAEKSMGNGRIDLVSDVIYIPKERFDKSKTQEMAAEIEKLNAIMIAENKKYVLIGPGRWGTRDKFIGVPVNWPQISAAKVIVETSLEDFPLDASSGSHFFHNVTSMNVGYLSVQPELTGSYISWNMLSALPAIHDTTYFRHVRFEKHMAIRMDGKKRISVITAE